MVSPTIKISSVYAPAEAFIPKYEQKSNTKISLHKLSVLEIEIVEVTPNFLNWRQEQNFQGTEKSTKLPLYWPWSYFVSAFLIHRFSNYTSANGRKLSRTISQLIFFSTYWNSTYLLFKLVPIPWCISPKHNPITTKSRSLTSRK